MNQEHFPSLVGGALSFPGKGPIVTPVSRILPGSDEAFQKLLLRIATKACERTTPDSIIKLFCQATREFFQVSGVYFWRCQAGDELVGEHADGKLADHFAGLRIRPDQSAATAEAVRQRRTVYANRVENKAFPAVAEYHARSLMSAPLMVSNEVIGAVTFLHDSAEEFFNEDLAAKATILAGQLGSLLEANRLSDASREEHRRAEILADVAHVLHGKPDVAAVIEALADRLRLLLRARLVCVLLRREGPFELRAVSAETPQLAATARARHDRQTLRFAADLAQRAVTAGEPIAVSIGTDAHSLGNLVSPGMLIAAPFRSSRTQGAILVYPRQEGIFTPEERALVSVVAGFGAVAVAHAELHSTAHAQAHELHQLLEISSELSSSSDLEHFLQAFVIHACDFLGYGRCFIALLENDQFRVRYGVDHGESKRVDLQFPDGVATKALRNKEVFWTDEASRTPGANLDAVAQFQIHQFLAVPLLGTNGQLLGMFGLLDRLDGTGISQEDIRRARALSNQAAVALEVARNLHLSERHRRRAEALIELAREMDGALRLPEFAKRFVARAADLTGSRAGFLAVLQDGRWQVVALHPSGEPQSRTAVSTSPGSSGPTSASAAPASPTSGSAGVVTALTLVDLPGTATRVAPANPTPARPADTPADTAFDRVLGPALAEFVSRRTGTVASGSTEELLGATAAAALGWSDCTLVSLPGSNGQLSGLLALSRVCGPHAQAMDGGAQPAPLGEDDRAFLETMAGHAAMALENSRLFTRIERSNRHWMEIFDAISDLIVVHDPAGKVLRVNRSLAGLIGVPPAELIGVDMRALLAPDTQPAANTCPFCRALREDKDEFVHRVFDRTYLVSTSAIHGDHDEGLQTIHVMKDVSDRQEAEARYRELFDNIQEGLFFSTPNGRFVEVNDAMVRMLGYESREELLQIDIPTQLYFSPQQRERHAEVMTESGGLRNFEATLRRKDGSPIHVLINAFGLYDHASRLLQIRGLMLDVTGLRTYQSELHRERDFSAKILGNTQSLILVSDTAGLISYANQRWYDAGFEQRELIGRPLVELVVPAFAPALSEALHNTLSGQQVDNLELQIVRGGATGKFSANLSPMRDEKGNVTSIVAVLTDITDSAVLRDKLVHAEKMAAVGQLVAGVAHEVNNPLTAILGFADLLLESEQVPEEARKDLRVILQEAQRTKQIVQNLLSFARQMPPQRSTVQLNTILRRTIQLRSYDFHSHGINIVELLDENLPEVMGDAHQLQQVFLNILNNAYDAVHEGGRRARIEIMSTKAGDAVEVSFRDNGYGISQPDKVFDPFFTTKDVGKGTGLGLSICYGIVREHGGEIQCHNNTDGQGATFIVRLPANPRTASLSVAVGGAPTGVKP